MNAKSDTASNKAEWFENYLKGVAKARGKEAATRLLADVKDQAKKGNKGEAGDWL